MRGFTFIDVLVGTFLVLIVFLGILGAYQLGLKVIGQSQRRITATAIAQGELEELRNLPYQSIGVEGSFPEGVLASTTTKVFNNVEYTIERRVDFVVDELDGLSPPDDECPNDYKKAQIKVSWQDHLKGEVILTTDITPKSLAEECGTGGGILAVSVFDARGGMVNLPLIEIKNPITNQVLKTATPEEGRHYFSLATSTYKVVVSKTGYSSERTYGTDEIALPEKPHPIVLEAELVENSFAIDKLSSFLVKTLSPWGQALWSDSFLDESKISQKSNLTLSQGYVKLATTSDGYLPSGYLLSTEVAPSGLTRWDEFIFTDEEPDLTDLKYQIYYATNTDWFLVPPEDLPGNEAGFDVSPVNLSNLSGTNYPKLKLLANFTTNTTSSSPLLDNWQLSWITSEPTPIAQVSFVLEGAKIIGKDAKEQPVYKYSATFTSDSSGISNITDLEWDLYTFSLPPDSDLDLVGTNPSPQPISLVPDTILPVDLYLEAENSLLVTLQSQETLQPIFAAQVRLFNADLAYDATQYTNEKGQTYFIPLSPGTYTLEAEAAGYLPATTTVVISGDATKTISLEQME